MIVSFFNAPRGGHVFLAIIHRVKPDFVELNLPELRAGLSLV